MLGITLQRFYTFINCINLTFYNEVDICCFIT